MKVKCTKILDSISKNELASSSWLTIGKIYHVLSVYCVVGKNVEYRLVGDDGHTPALFLSEEFELVTNTIPSNWVVDLVPGKYLELTPRKWCDANFWEQYFDRDPEAVACFEYERNRILNDDP